MIKRLLTCLALAGCSVPRIPAMHRRTAGRDRQAPAKRASSSFGLPSSCDTSDYPTIVDENGRFVGNAGSNTSFVVRVMSGRHTFYAWPNIDVRTARVPNYDPVGALAVDATAGGVSRVAIVIPKGRSLRCEATFELVAGGESDGARAEFEAWTRDAMLVEPDIEAGVDDLRRNASVVCAHLEAGRRRLRAALPPTCCAATRATAEGQR
jgi:hypothetical protein